MTSLRKKLRVLPRRQTVLLLVDASDSMGDEVTVRMRVAKGVALALLDRAYVNRYRVGVIVFRDRDAERILTPTNSVELARRTLRELTIGGATPLSAGLDLAVKTLKQERTKHPGSDPLLVILSDGEANIPLTPEEDVFSEVLSFGKLLHRERISSLIVKTGTSLQGSNLLRRFAEASGGHYKQVNRLTPGTVLDLLDDPTDKSPSKENG